MITYVNTVLVGTGKNSVLKAAPAKAKSINEASADAGKYVIMNLDQDAADIYAVDENTKKIKVGIVTGKNTACRKKDGSVEYIPVVKWSNDITKESVKSFVQSKWFESTPEKVEIDFNGTEAALMADFALGEKRIIVRITYKDMPTRYRKWTESYEYVTKIGDNAESIAQNLAIQINKQYKRARVLAAAEGGVLTLTAMEYMDDDKNDTINWAAKVRFSVNAYWTDPTAPAFASKNKYAIAGAEITKTPGSWCQTDAKLVRDRESQAMGYQGILNRGECTWPIIKPDMVTDITKHYDGVTLEFEKVYRSADDLFRRTKETVEIYDITGTLNGLIAELTKFAGEPADNGIVAQ